MAGSRPVLLALGSVNADFQARTPRPLEAGETLLADGFARRGGGKAANVAFLAHRLGHPVRLIARVGDDDLREQALAPLRRAGLCLDGVTTAPGSATAVSMIAVPPNGKKSIVLAGNANEVWDEKTESAMIAAIETAPAGSMLCVDFEIAPRVAARALAAARARGMPSVLDPAPAGRVDAASLAACFATTPDAREAGELTGIDTSELECAAHAATILHRRGPALACVKLGDGGCAYARAGGLIHVPPVPVDVVDTTGAGDAFTGALCVALLEGKAPDDAVLFAVACSHLAVGADGSQEAYPDRTTIEALLPRLAAGVRDLEG